MAKRFRTREAVDFVVIGSGSAGGILAKELSTAGHSVVVLEQGPYRKAHEFSHDALEVEMYGELTGDQSDQTFRHTDDEEARPSQGGPGPAWYARGVGGSSVHFTANFWRLRPIDFRERSLLGPISGTTFADWPITYEELEPYYTRVDWEIGVSGAPGPNDPPRSRPFPVPPMPVKSSGVLLDKGARKLGMTTQPEPLAILSKPHNGRPACISCGYCMGFGCEVGAKSSTLAAMIPAAEASGNCEIRPLSTVIRIDTDEKGRASQVVYIDGKGQQQAQKARAVVLSANGAETPRLLLMSANPKQPDGLANSSGYVGKNLMLNQHALAHTTYEHPLNDYKGVQVTRMIHDFYESDPKRGYYGGGGIDARPLFAASPILYAMLSIPEDIPRWGAGFKDYMAHNFTRSMALLASTTSLAMERNNITLDPNVSDKLGRPGLRMTYKDHDDDLDNARFFRQQLLALGEASGATRVWADEVGLGTGGAHLLGTCRMGDDPQTSVVDRDHRSHDIPNLFICDGSSMVTSGRGQPTHTIMALAFRAADKIKAAAAAGNI